MKKRFTITLGLILLVILSSGCSALQGMSPSVSEACLPVEDDMSLIQLEDSLVLNGEETYILDSDTGAKIPLPINRDITYYSILSDFMISPDYEKIAYLEVSFRKLDGELTFINDTLKVFLSNGEELNVDYWHPEPDVERLIEWFDNDRLLISTTDDLDGTIILMNPITGERQRIHPSFPGIYKFDPIQWYKSANPLPLYNQSMSLVFYLRFSEDNPEGNMEFVLYDLTKEKRVWSRIVHDPQIRPQWSADQDKLLIAVRDSSSSDYELFMIDQYGQETKLSDFSSVYHSTYISGLSWSPDGQKIGFWLDGRDDEKDEHNPRFAIYDLHTKQTTDYCIGKGRGQIYWSPSGNQLAFRAEDRNNPELWHAIVFDLQKNVAVKIADHEEPVGWISIE